MAAWLKAVGVTGGNIPAYWYQEWPSMLGYTQFPRRPSITVGDLLIYYAVGHRRVCAVVEATSAAVNFLTIPITPDSHPGHWNQWSPENQHRWPWWMTVDARVIIPVNENAPTLADIGISGFSVRNKPHIRLTPDQFARAAGAIVNVALKKLEVDHAKTSMDLD